jgi:single-strand DNA-binding protein
MALNKVMLVGNVGKEPEIRTLTNGGRVATFSLATTDVWKDKTTHEKREKTEWHKIVIYSIGLVNIVEKYVKKGSRLFIEGSLQTRKWTNQSGEERYATEVVLQGFNANLQLLDRLVKSQTDDIASESVMIDEDDLNTSLDDEIPF